MSEKEELVKKFNRAARTIIAAGPMPFPLTETFVKILEYYMDEKDLEFIKAFKIRPSLTMEQIQKKLKDWTEEDIDKQASSLAKKGFIFNQPSSKGLMVYRLMPIVMIGAFEYQFMQELPKDDAGLKRLKEISELYEQLMKELAGAVQKNYDTMSLAFGKSPPFDRTVPLQKNVSGKTIEINETIGAEEQVLPAQTVEKIINKYDDIAVGNCFCRQYREMLGENFDDIGIDAEVCFTFGKSARHVIQQGFARRVSKEQAIEIMKNIEEAGLVHKAFHNKSDITKEENSICNCHQAYCDNFRLHREGAFPILNTAFYLAQVDQDTCTGCETCEEKCPMEAIAVGDENKAEVNDERCIGCGVCAHFCPENAISLQEGQRRVYIPPPRLKT
ncbi:MAG: 4Fe-4S binding protein [Candidatus Helarchaeota archaeon]|nr:4Fe-4S binding protein [Candidatus Helarchaeota archaeon]